MRVQISRQSCVFLATVYSPATLRAQNFRAATALHLRRFSATQKGIGNGSHKNIAYWLLSMSGLVAGMVTIGGITRITRSGLSMTDWKLQGSLPPLTLEQWSLEFERYKTFPEWKQRQSMSLDEFKFIYFWEYGHRMMGRFLGIAFTVPLAIFAIRGNIPNFLYPRLGLLFGLGGTQGLIGWWMVKSGLEVDPEQRKEIRVSPYRLATHLTMAFTTYSLLLWTGLDLLNTPNIAMREAGKLSAGFLKHSKSLRGLAIVNTALVATTVVSGAYVAGNDAGRAYNTFPKMGDDWIPEGILSMSPLWRNIVENTATVQFDHRLLALTTLGSIWGMYWRATSLEGGALWRSLPALTRTSFNAVAGMSLVQVGLGISTLLLYVPTHLAVTHQAGSLALLTFTTCLVHSLRFSLFGSTAAVTAGAAASGAAAGAAAAGVMGAVTSASAAAATVASSVARAGTAGATAVTRASEPAAAGAVRSYSTRVAVSGGGLEHTRATAATGQFLRRWVL